MVAVSCFLLALPEGMTDPVLDAVNAQIHTDLAALEASGAAVEVITPGEEFLEVSGWGLHLMDPGRVRAAFDAGRRQAATVATRLGGVWS